MPPGRITELAANIKEETIKLEGYLEAEGLPSPSFAPDFPAKLELSDSAAASMQQIIEAADELHSLLLGPLRYILHQLDGTHNLISLHAVNRFKIFSRFPVGQEISFTEVAAKCKMDEESMRRILQHAITNNIFAQPKIDFISHTSVSRSLAHIPMLSDWVTVSCEEMWAPTTKVVDALVKWPASAEPTETAFNLASGVEKSFFQELGSSPERIERFSRAMGLFKVMPGFETSLVTEATLWHSGTRTVVDVGGADGAVAYELARKFPSMRIIVQDLPNVVENAKSMRNTDLLSQVTFQSHDFFCEQPVHGSDVYIFRMIFHDWSDKFCIRILQQLVPALKPGATLLINDFCIPNPGTTSKYQERLARCHDLSMKAMFNGKERNKTEWETLLWKADSRFEIVSVAQLPSSPLALFEVAWKA
ncbi:O-methyltransferase aurJ [Lachnellula arida]|uniref:O-methyltransferase aurJ n=1 Tax=Lachnellula arida TaxID=1316785 RepID=A0A8T9BNV8_9HELO|nr:O-methyltransferase aurJ [Lachnellula arida]